MQNFKFDESNLPWRQLDWLENVWFYVYNVDRRNGIVDVMFKFAPHSKALLHRHKSDYVTLVLQGELRLYHPDGTLKEIRPAGSYVMGAANGEPHTEGGGDEEAIVFFSNRNVDDALYEFRDEDRQPTVTLRIGDFEAQLKDQGAPKWQAAA